MSQVEQRRVESHKLSRDLARLFDLLAVKHKRKLRQLARRARRAQQEALHPAGEPMQELVAWASDARRLEDFPPKQRKLLKMLAAGKGPETHTCRNCGELFWLTPEAAEHGSGVGKAYCTDACQRERWVKHRRDVRNQDRVTKVTCEMCGAEIPTSRGHKRFCGSACKQKAYRARKESGA